MKALPLKEAKKKLSKLVERVSAVDDEIVIVRRGQLAAVLISAGKYASWKETIAICSDRSFLREIRAGIRALKSGRARLYTVADLLR